MSAQVISRKEWSATHLALIASIVACTVSGIIIVITMGIAHVPGVTWTLLDKVFAFMFCYMQLMASTVWSLQVKRHGNMIEGVVYTDLGDDYVQTTVRGWTTQWFISVLCSSAIAGIAGIVVILLVTRGV